MAKLHEDYYIRKCCLKNNEVPSQSVMKKKMGSGLAEVYFKSMSPSLRVIAGLDPPLRGGGENWYMPPEEILDGRAVLKPIQRKYLNKFSCDGIISFGKKCVDDHRRYLEVQKNKLLIKSDANWKKIVIDKRIQEWDAVSAREQNKNTLRIKQAVDEFSVVYRTSLTKIESLLRDTAQIELERIKHSTYDEMYKKLLRLEQEQSNQLLKTHKDKLEAEKNKYKEKFLHDIENLRTEHEKNIAAINIEKYTALEKLRSILGYQSLACQVYVALKERTECEKDIETSKKEHKKSIKLLSEQIKIKDDKISSALDEIVRQNELNRLWQNKVCHVVRRFQEFVKYCLHNIPEQAEFFINMEKLMLLQLSEALDNPVAVNILEIEDEHVQTPAPKPQPFLLVCDEETKPQIDPDLCPQHTGASSSQMSVIVVNKRCIYAACDNLELLGDKLEKYLAGRDITDETVDGHDYNMDVPIHCTSSEQLLELKLESSLMQILQDEFLKVKQVVTQCAVCGNRYCFCSPKHKKSTVTLHDKVTSPKPANELDKTGILKLAREPKIDSYLKYIRPKICDCAMKAKKHLQEHLPAYMQNVSTFEKVSIPQYETCELYELKKLVKEARNMQDETEIQVEDKTRDAGTQYSDQHFDVLYDSFSEAEIERIFRELRILSEANDKSLSVFEYNTPMSHIEKEAQTFAFEAARTLKKMIVESPKLEEIFKSKRCA